MMFEILLAKIAHEVSLLHLGRKKDIHLEPVIRIMEVSQAERIIDGGSRSDLACIWGCYRWTFLFYVRINTELVCKDPTEDNLYTDNSKLTADEAGKVEVSSVKCNYQFQALNP